MATSGSKLCLIGQYSAALSSLMRSLSEKFRGIVTVMSMAPKRTRGSLRAVIRGLFRLLPFRIVFPS